LLDVSGLSVDNQEVVRLTQQYRVPRDIAGVLNARVYNGNFRTPTVSKVTDKGFHLVYVESPLPVDDGKYVNKNEVDAVLSWWNNPFETDVKVFLF
jgi:hypothetical protein